MHRWADQNLLDQEHVVRYKELLQVVERSRLIYDRMLAQWDADVEASRAESERNSDALLPSDYRC